MLKLNQKNNNEKINFKEWLDIIKGTTIMDLPISFHWDKLYKQYPDCKVILRIRNFDEWYKSWIIYYFGYLIDPICNMIILDYRAGMLHAILQKLKVFVWRVRTSKQSFIHA